MKINESPACFFTEGVDYPAFKQNADKEDLDSLLNDEVTSAAQKAFGINYLFPWQRIVIANILDAAESDCGTEHDVSYETVSALTHEAPDQTDVSPDDSALLHESKSKETEIIRHQIVLLPTGAGKSLCFLTPALMLKGATLVLYPLIALMQDQKRRMDEGGLQSVVFRGGQTEQEREENFKRIQNGAKIILANPEVLQNKNLIDRLCECRISHIAIDEAHCVSEWGDSFRPAYLTLGEIIKKLSVPVVTAFTATASPEVLNRVAEVLFDGDAHIVRSDSDRPNIHYNVVNAFAKKRETFKLALRSPKPLIVFCGTRKNSEDMARELSEYYGKDKVRFYHAGLTKAEKTAVEQWFHPSEKGILCCTCAYGMGVDKKNVRSVLHYMASPTVEAYIQEAGRGGRDGSIATGTLVWSYADSAASISHPYESRERKMGLFAESTTCRRQVLLDALGGEEAYCDGCDVCERGGPAPFARDAELVLNLVRKNKRRLRRKELCFKAAKMLNEIDSEEFKMNIWEEGDAEEIIAQLFAGGWLRECLWPWYKKIDCSFKKNAPVRQIKILKGHFRPGRHLLPLKKLLLWGGRLRSFFLP